jgi:hypothetical protein
MPPRPLRPVLESALSSFRTSRTGCLKTSRTSGAARLRRLGRQWARLELGIAGRQAVTRYQLAATELAAAGRRRSLGQTTEDAYLRHRDDSLTLMRAAAAVIRRQEQLYPPPWIAPGAPSVFVTFRPGSPG